METTDRFKIGDRVEVLSNTEEPTGWKIGVITAIEERSSPRIFRVNLADGQESVFSDTQLRIPSIIFADMILDTFVSPVPHGIRGSTSGRHMRFISREFDIHLKLVAKRNGRNRLLGQLTSNDGPPATALVSLLVDGEAVNTTTTDAYGEFSLHETPMGSTTVEILVPTQRIVVTF